MSSITVEVDTVVDAAYIRLSDGAPVRTIAHNELINIDLDDVGVVVGLEVLSIGVIIPMSEILDR